jgi:hypothetical protein
MPPSFRAGAADVAPHAASAGIVMDAHGGDHADEFPSFGQAEIPVVSNSRAFRGGSVSVAAPADVAGQLTGDGMAGALVGIHGHAGNADPRALWTGTPDGRQAGAKGGTAPDALLPSSEHIVNGRDAADAGTQQAPSVYRAGSTSAANTRTAVRPFWLFLRPFDKWTVDNLAPVLAKLPQPSPRAATPPMAGAVSNPEPNAGGYGTIGGMEASGVKPNTVRLLPRPWDELAVQTAGDTGQHMTVAAARSWRAS